MPWLTALAISSPSVCTRSSVLIAGMVARFNLARPSFKMYAGICFKQAHHGHPDPDRRTRPAPARRPEWRRS